MEATRGNGYAPVWGSLVMMMMMMKMMNVGLTDVKDKQLIYLTFRPIAVTECIQNTILAGNSVGEQAIKEARSRLSHLSLLHLHQW